MSTRLSMASSLLALAFMAGACQKQAPAPARPAPTTPVPPAAPAARDADASMVGILTRFKVLPDKHEATVALLRELAAEVKKTEPGTVAYVFFRSRTDPQEIIVFEIFADADARKTHGQSAALAAARQKLPELVDMKTLVIEPLEGALLGFVR